MLNLLKTIGLQWLVLKVLRAVAKQTDNQLTNEIVDLIEAVLASDPNLVKKELSEVIDLISSMIAQNKRVQILLGKKGDE
jgi:hypothetical protein